jgi:hypothetical protein
MTVTRTVTIEHHIPVDELESMAETAQGGIGYWAIHMGGNIWSEFEEPADPFGEVTPTGKKFKLDADLIHLGISRMGSEGSPGWHSIAKYVIGNEGGADIDACDALVQYGVFGDLVYG